MLFRVRVQAGLVCWPRYYGAHADDYAQATLAGDTFEKRRYWLVANRVEPLLISV